jgi:hypothetical protein
VDAIDVIYVDDSGVIEGAEDRTEVVRDIVQQEGGERQGIFFWPLKLSDVFDDERAVQCSADYAGMFPEELQWGVATYLLNFFGCL